METDLVIKISTMKNDQFSQLVSPFPGVATNEAGIDSNAIIFPSDLNNIPYKYPWHYFKISIWLER